MIALEAVFEYAVPGLLLDQTLIGQKLPIPGSTRWIAFPRADEQQNHGPRSPFRRSDLISGHNEVNGALVALEVNAVAIGLPVDAEVDAADPDPQVVQAVLADAAPQAVATFGRVSEWLRCNREYHWLLSRSSLPINPVSAGLYVKDGERLPYGSIVMGGVSFRGRNEGLTRSNAERILQAVGGQAAPPLWEQFLADAASAREQTHAVVLAAIACEIAVKSALQQSADETQHLLVSLLLNNPRDHSMAAAALFDQPCLAVLNRSLKSDDRELHKRVVRLFEDRNRIAHGSLIKLRSHAELGDEVQAAAEAVDWLYPRSG